MAVTATKKSTQCFDLSIALDSSRRGAYRQRMSNNNRPEKVIIFVVPDDCKKEMWMVVIRESSGTLIGIPLRGVTKPVAEQNRQSLGFAFDYGAKYATKVMARQANKLWWSVDHDHNPED